MTDGTEFRATARVERGHATLEVSGDVDAHVCSRLEHLVNGLLDDAPDALTIDLAGVSFIDSSGLRVLLLAHELGRARRTDVAIANPSPAARRLLAWTGLDTVVAVAEQPAVASSPATPATPTTGSAPGA